MQTLLDNLEQDIIRVRYKYTFIPFVVKTLINQQCAGTQLDNISFGKLEIKLEISIHLLILGIDR